MQINDYEYEYRKLLQLIIDTGTLTENRTNVMTLMLFNYIFNIDLQNGFPILTGKKIHFNKAYHEFKWIYDGHTNVEYLNKHGIKWWNDYADDNGNLDKTYGYQLRNYNSKFDQIKYVINEIKNNSRRAHITFWNPNDLSSSVLPCCYTGFTFVKTKTETLNMSMQFRSSDVFLGLPYDVIVGALFLHEIAKQTNLKPGNLSLVLSNAHVYRNHLGPILRYMDRPIHKLPTYTYPYGLTEYTTEKLITAELNGVMS